MREGEKPDALVRLNECILKARAWIQAIGGEEDAEECCDEALAILPRLREVVEAARVLTKQQWTGTPDEYRPVDPRAMCALTLDLALKFVMLEGGPDGA